MADKLITLAKRNNETSRRKAHGILYVRSSCDSPPIQAGRQDMAESPYRYTDILSLIRGGTVGTIACLISPTIFLGKEYIYTIEQSHIY